MIMLIVCSGEREFSLLCFHEYGDRGDSLTGSQPAVFLLIIG